MDKQQQANNLDKSKLIYQVMDKVYHQLSAFEDNLNKVYPYTLYGSLVSAIGTTLEAYIPTAKIGDLCQISDPNAGIDLTAEVMALNGNKAKLLPYGSIENISQNCKFRRLEYGFKIAVGDFLLGKIVDGFGNITGNIVASDDKRAIYQQKLAELRSINCLAPEPFERPLISEQLHTGVKAIDLFTTCGVGQRIGIFAGPGIGKTTLMGMIIRNAQVDVIVVALVGERGREVREFIDLELKGESAKRCVLVVATSDRPAVEQLKSAYIAQTIAEYFRDQGKKVLLFVDSITRFARAGREVGLSSGEPITRGGFPPSVFLSFPKLMERAGNTQKGSISAFYTVLMEGENLNEDAVAEEVKSIIDGHLVLSRKIAEQGRFPAIDILKSLSRIADRIITDKHRLSARHIRLLLSKYDELEFLIRVGEYKKGHDRLADEAIEKYQQIIELLKQDQNETAQMSPNLERLMRLAG